MALQVGAMQEVPQNGAMPLSKPRLEIVEQPKSRGFRFRYDCEGQSHGGLPGENSERNRKQKTYPTVRLIGYRGKARVMVSLVSDSDPPVPHAHSIVGKNTYDGRCIVEMGPETEMYAQFPNMGILHVTKKKVPEVLTKRLLQQLRMRDTSALDQLDIEGQQNLSEDEMEQVRKEAQQISKTMNLSVVRLCFQAFLIDEHGRFTIAVDPVFSHKVYDSKAPSAGTLKICRLDRANGSVRGGDDVFLLCDKVQKNDIEVLFYEEKSDNSINPVQPWSAKGRFGPNDVHHQYAIVFQTPPFYNLAIERPVTVWIALRRPSDSELSEPKPFLYLPQEFDEERIGAKRKKKLQHFNNFFDGGGAGGGLGNFFSRSGFGSGGDMGGFGQFFKDNGGGGGGGGGGGSGYGGGGGGNQAAGFNGIDLSTELDMYGSATNFSSASNSHLPMSHPNYGGQFGNYGDSHMNIPPPYRAGMQQGPPGMFSDQSIDSFYGQQYPMFPNHDITSKGGSASSRHPAANMIGGGGMQPQIKQEIIDSTFEDIEFDGGSRPPRRPQASAGSSRPRPPSPQKGVDDEEDLESGFADNLESMEQGPNPATNVGDTAAEAESRAAGQALMDRQQAAFQVCERMFNALLAWATTRDVRYLLAAQRSLTAVQNQQGDTALHLAIIHNHQDVVLQLLDVLPQLPPTETPVVDCLNNLKQSPLHLAVLTRQHKVIQYLLKANANPLVCDREGNTPLHLACRMGFIQGAVTMLHRTNHINAEGCRIPEVHIRNSNGETPLHLAAKNGCTDAIKLLVDAKADVDVQDSKSGKTALHHAVENDDLPMVGYLVTEADCNKDCCDFSGNTPLHVAAGLGRSAISSLLIAAGTDVSIQNQEGETPRMHAEYGNHDEVAKILREAVEMESMNRDEDQLTSQMESVSIKQESDMRLLDFRARISLAILLDEQGTWRQLCRMMNLSTLESGFATFSSPTKEVLAMFEACEGTITQLRQFLKEMNRPDAINIIDQALLQQETEKSSRSSGGEGSSGSRPRVFGSDPVMTKGVTDSGIVSQSASEELGAHISSRLPQSTEAPTFPSLQVAHTQA